MLVGRRQTSLGAALRLAAVSASLCAAVLLVAPSASAYRSAGQLPEFRGPTRVRWSSDPIAYRLYDRLPEGLNPVGVEQVARQAFSTWATPSCSGVAFYSQGLTSQPAAPGDGVSTIQWI